MGFLGLCDGPAGLSNCTAIRELYLAGNKISDVEGLHRLLKLAVLDLSFNKITTAKALGQLVANYHSLLALNLVGNPVQANVGDDALRRAVTLSVPDARVPLPYGTFDDDAGRRPWQQQQPERSESFPPAGASQRMSWNDLIERVFDKDEDGQIVLRSSVFS